MLMIVCPMVFLAALIDSIAGGGGLISLPAYMLALPGNTALASGTNKFTASAGTLFAASRFAKEGRIAWKCALCAAAGALSAYFGAHTLSSLPEQTIRTIIMAALPVVAVIILVRRDIEAREVRETTGRLLMCAGIGVAVGFYDGLIGPGTGTFLIILLNMAMGLDMVSASGTAKVVNLTSNAAALVRFLLGGQVLFTLGLPAMACSIAGGLLGAWLAVRIGGKFIRFMLIGVLALMLIKLVWDMLM